jgi:hypothetical protein
MIRLLRWLQNAWFTLALIFLALFAIPGLVLVVLTLLQLDAPVNDWLQENFQISYQLALSPWLAVLLLLLPLVVLILYFLKLKRKPVQVPSTFLWKKSIEDLHVNTLFQWLRQNVLLVLQILALLFLTYSVLGIRFHGGKNRARHYILLIDNSASMSATDVSPSRLDWAKQEALKEIDAAGDSDYGMVIVFNSKASTLQTYTNNRGKLREVVRNIAPTQRSTRIEEALSLAESLANPVRSTEDAASQPEDVPAGQERTFVQARGIAATVHLFSDGRFARLSEAALAGLSSRQAGNFSALGNLNLHYHAAGKITPGQADNLAIVALSAARLSPPPGKKPVDPDLQKLRVLIRTQNYRKEAVKVRLKLDVFVEGELARPDQKDIDMKGHVFTKGEGEDEDKDEPGEAFVTFDLPPLDLRRNIVLHAYLADVRDAFPLDDHAWLAVGATRKAKVLIVGPANPILDAFFEQEATQRLAQMQRLGESTLGTEEYRKHARSGDIDLVIFDRCTPTDEADMPLANTLFIDRPPPPWQRGTRLMKNPLPVPSRQPHPLLRHITTLWDVRVSEAFAFNLRSNLDPKALEETKLPDGDPRKRVLPGMTRVVETSSGTAEKGESPPLVFTLGRGPYTDVVLAFALLGDDGDLMCDWPLQPSFPLFFRNVLYTLGNVDDAVRAAGVAPGEPMVLRPEAGVSRLTVTAPDGSAQDLQKLPHRADFEYAATERLGIYSYRTGPEGGAGRSFAVNLLDASESNIEPRPEIRIGSESVAAGQDRSQPRELWKWILLVAVVLLVVEWGLYNRRISV